MQLVRSQRRQNVAGATSLEPTTPPAGVGPAVRCLSLLASFCCGVQCLLELLSSPRSTRVRAIAGCAPLARVSLARPLRHTHLQLSPAAPADAICVVVIILSCSARSNAIVIAPIQRFTILPHWAWASRALRGRAPFVIHYTGGPCEAAMRRARMRLNVTICGEITHPDRRALPERARAIGERARPCHGCPHHHTIVRRDWCASAARPRSMGAACGPLRQRALEPFPQAGCECVPQARYDVEKQRMQEGALASAGRPAHPPRQAPARSAP